MSPEATPEITLEAEVEAGMGLILRTLLLSLDTVYIIPEVEVEVELGFRVGLVYIIYII